MLSAVVYATQNSLSPALGELHLSFKYGRLGEPLCENAMQKSCNPRKLSTHGGRQRPSRLHRHLTRVVYVISDGARSLYNKSPTSSVCQGHLSLLQSQQK